MATNPNPSKLDPGQIAKRVYDESNDRIRVDANITAPDGMSILIDATTDSIKIGNTASGPFLNVNVDGSINTSGSVSGTVTANISGLATFQTSQYTVGLSAVQLTPTPLADRSSMSIKVTTTTSSDVVYIGNSSAVTTANGYPLFNGDSVQLDLKPAQTVYAIGTAASQLVYVMEVGG